MNSVICISPFAPAICVASSAGMGMTIWYGKTYVNRKDMKKTIDILGRGTHTSAMTNLLEAIETHLKEHGISATDFGRKVMNNPNFVFDLRKGADPRLSTYCKVLAHIEATTTPCNPSSDATQREAS